jgi:L-ascorbate metabolism protein UlaG (beta-lactamase superfamily)
VATKYTRLLFDPNLSSRLFCLDRLDKPYWNEDVLRSLSGIVVSNAHHNRFNLKSYKFFPQSTPVIVPQGCRGILNKYFHFPIKEIEAGETLSIGDLTITAEKALHRGSRYLGLKYTQAFHYVITHENQKILYASDTRYAGSYFYELGQRHHFKAALMPIDPISPPFLAGKRYLKPAQTAQALLDLNAQLLIPYAYGSFLWGKRDPQAALQALQQQAEHLEIADRVKIISVGEKILMD